MSERYMLVIHRVEKTCRICGSVVLTWNGKTKWCEECRTAGEAASAKRRRERAKRKVAA
jgi:hypothetical protein